MFTSINSNNEKTCNVLLLFFWMSKNTYLYLYEKNIFHFVFFPKYAFFPILVHFSIKRLTTLFGSLKRETRQRMRKRETNLTHSLVLLLFFFLSGGMLCLCLFRIRIFCNRIRIRMISPAVTRTQINVKKFKPPP